VIEFLRSNPSEVASRYRGHPLASKIIQVWGNSATFDFSPWHNKVDLVYVDGAHTYQFVKSDIENALKMLRPGGSIVFDDFDHLGDNFGVTRAIMDHPIGDRVVQIEDTSFCVYRDSKNAAPV
jgi:predicted O-methyltransferase YrrM